MNKKGTLFLAGAAVVGGMLALVAAMPDRNASPADREPTHVYGKYREPVEFKTPGDYFVRYTRLDPESKRSAWKLTMEDYKPSGKWTLWVLTNYWSDYRALNDEYDAGFSVSRYKSLDQYLRRVANFRTMTDLDFDIKVIAYGAIGQFNIMSQSPLKGSLAHGSDTHRCKMAYLGCADKFYFSPVPIPEEKKDSDWMQYLNHYIKPYAGVHDAPEAWRATERRMEQDQRGAGLIAAPDMVFLVNPKGKAEYGWTGLYGLKRATTEMVGEAIVESLGADAADPKIAPRLQAMREFTGTPIVRAYHGLTAEDANLGYLAGSISKVMDVFTKMHQPE